MSVTAETLATSGNAPRDLPTLGGLDVRGKRVLLRVDYNIPGLPDGSLYDDYRIAASLPTLKKLLQNGARVGILTHRGRPGGRAVPELSTKPLAGILGTMLGQDIEHVPDCVGRVAEQAMDRLAPGQAIMFENLRYHLGEQLNQHPFVKELSQLGEIFVNDAFATAHRAHASTSGLAAMMPVSVIGELMARELTWLRRLAGTPERPLLLILGGNHVQPKLELMRHLLTRVDTVMVGGAVANTFMAARDLGMGQSLLDPSMVEMARDLLTEAGVVGCRLHLPQDVWVKHALKADLPAEVRPVHEIGAQEGVVDIGPQTLNTWKRLVKDAGTSVLIGCMGIAERAEGRESTLGLAATLAEQRGFSLVGGNSMLPLLQQAGLRERLPALSTGGAALVDGLLGKPLPCIEVLKARG